MEIHKSANRDPLPKMGREQYEMTATQVAEVMGISRQRVEHINQGSLDAAADAYEAEYNEAQEARRAERDAEMRADAFGPKHG